MTIKKIDFEKDIKYLPVISLLLIIMNTAAFILQIGGGIESPVTTVGLLERSAVFHGEIWRIVTSMFLHGNFSHFSGNMVILYILGMACEHAVGSKNTGLIYFVSGIIGAVFSMAFTNAPSLGASGAIFGLLGASIIFFIHYKESIYLRNKNIGLFLAAWAGYSIFCGFFTPYIDNFCHVGGFLGGGFTMFYLLPVPAWETTE